MNNISISNILAVPEEEIVGDCFSTTVHNAPSIKSEVNNISRLTKERHDSKIKLYRMILLECIKKIKREYEFRRTDTFFKIDEFVYGHPEYDKDECIEYIIVELKKFYYDVLQICSTKIFISWKYTELHKTSQFLPNPNNNIQ